MQQQLGFRTQRDADKTVGAMVAVSIIGVIASLFLLGGNEPVGGLRSALGYMAAITPFAAISAGVLLPDQIQTLLVSAWRLDPEYRKRLTYHEAGHFLLGYLLGLECDGYDAATGTGASSAVSLRLGSAAAADPRSHATLDSLAVLSMGGIAAEVIACGDAEGGIADVAQLRGLMEVASPPISAKTEQDDRVRWGTLMALTLLQQHRGALDACAAKFEEGGSVGECVAAIEAAAAGESEKVASESEPREVAGKTR